MRKSNRLTVLRVNRETEPGRYGDGHGLYLQVNNAGAKCWVFRFMRRGRPRHMGLGALHTVNLAEAREKARAARQLLLEGKDPIETKRAAITAAHLAESKLVTFRKCADDFLRYSPVARTWTNDVHRKQWATTLSQYVYPSLGDIPVNAVDVPLVLKVLLPLWHRAPETASRVRGRIERILGWAKANGLRDGDNSAAWRGNLQDVLGTKPGQVHHAALPQAALPEFMVRLREYDAPSTRALEFLILTAARASEVFGARWDEIDFRESAWAVPAERMKGRRVHRVPLSPAAIELLNDLPRDGDLVFTGATGRPFTRSATLATLKRIDARATLHGFRSTFSDWAHERTAYPRDIIEMALAHAVKGKTEAAYWRGDAFDKRRRLMDEWARYCNSPGVSSGEVVSLQTGRA